MRVTRNIAPLFVALLGASTLKSVNTVGFRDDLRCGRGFDAPDGDVARCDPTGEYPCCSPDNRCGNTTDHCNCTGCVDHRDFRGDLRCGRGFSAPNGDSVARCDPTGEYPCCSPRNWCGNTTDHCDCASCVDYREREECEAILCPGDCGRDGHYFEEENCTSSCQCNDGYTGIPPNCTALNCSCHENASCIEDSDGVSFCECRDGHIGNGILCPDAANKCTPRCGSNQHCYDSAPNQGIFRCRCNDGFRNSTGHCSVPSSQATPERELMTTTERNVLNTAGMILNSAATDDHFNSDDIIIASSVGAGALLLCLLCLLGGCVLITRRKSRRATHISEGGATQITSGSVNNEVPAMGLRGATELVTKDNMVDFVGSENENETLYNPAYQSVDSGNTPAKTNDSYTHADPGKDRNPSTDKSHGITQENQNYDEPGNWEADEEHSYADVPHGNTNERSKVELAVTYDIPDGGLISKEGSDGRGQPASVKGHIYSPVKKKKKQGHIGELGSKLTGSKVITGDNDGIDEGDIYNIAYESCDSDAGLQDDVDSAATAPYHYIDGGNNGEDGGRMRDSATNIYDSV